MKNIDEQTKQKIVGIISVLIPSAKIILFGSRARGTHSQWSDIDLCLDAGKPLPIVDTGEVRSMFEGSNIPYIIEVVDFYSVSDAMRESIQQEGIVWKA